MTAATSPVIHNIRVEVNKRYYPVYKALTQDSPPLRSKVFEGHGQLFTLCAALGYRKHRSNHDFKGVDAFFSHYLDAHQQTVLKSIAIVANNHNYGVLGNGEEVVRIAEGYANGGMEVLLETVLSPYVYEEDDEVTLRFNDADELEKSILTLVFNEATKDPLA